MTWDAPREDRASMTFSEIRIVGASCLEAAVRLIETVTDPGLTRAECSDRLQGAQTYALISIAAALHARDVTRA